MSQRLISRRLQQLDDVLIGPRPVARSKRLVQQPVCLRYVGVLRGGVPAGELHELLGRLAPTAVDVQEVGGIGHLDVAHCTELVPVAPVKEQLDCPADFPLVERRPQGVGANPGDVVVPDNLLFDDVPVLLRDLLHLRLGDAACSHGRPG